MSGLDVNPVVKYPLEQLIRKVSTETTDGIADCFEYVS